MGLREPNAGTSRPAGMRLRPGRVVSRAIVGLLLAALVGGCVGAASRGPSPSPSGIPFTEAALKEALLVRFGSLVYCDPDFYPVARADEAVSALEHLAAMRADSAAWTAIAARFGFDPGSTPSGHELLAAYRDWKMSRALSLTKSGDDWSFDGLFGGTGPDAGTSPSVTHVVGTITADGTIHVGSEEPSGRPPCPICLARGTNIATPLGDVVVEALRPGDPVWTLDRLGRRVAAVVVQVGSMPVPPGHQVVRLVLADGRAVLVSPGHPLPDGRPVAALERGDRYDWSVVVSADRIPYDGGRTFDLLPSKGTGIYWANGIELGSTLFR
jgi:hypothetical protein